MSKYEDIVRHYEDCLIRHGDTHKGVDWPNAEDADRRYQVMLDLIWMDKARAEGQKSLLDFGCGTAMLWEYAIKTQQTSELQYSGLDFSPRFVEVSQAKFPDLPFVAGDVLKNPELLSEVDYMVLNGVFTEKRDLSFEEMFDYFTKLTTLLFSKCRRGIAFNVMSKAVDWEREDLFHMPTDLLIGFMTKNLSRNFIIRNDYRLFEFTTYLYK
jgi:SAM-dependent methyltransferase